MSHGCKDLRNKKKSPPALYRCSQNQRQTHSHFLILSIVGAIHAAERREKKAGKNKEKREKQRVRDCQQVAGWYACLTELWITTGFQPSSY